MNCDGKGCWRILPVQPTTMSSEPLIPESGSTSCDNLTALSHIALALQIQLIKRPSASLRFLERGAASFPTPNCSGAAGLSKMEMPSATKCFQTFANPVSRQRGRAPGALSHMVSANLRARALAPIIREIWAAGYMSYNAVSRELN